MLASPVAKPFPNSPHFSLPLVSQIQSGPTSLNKTRSYNHQFNCLGLGPLATEWVIACIQTAKKLHNSAEKHQSLKQPPAPGIEKGCPKCIPGDRAGLCINVTPSSTEVPPPKKKKLAISTGTTDRSYGPDYCPPGASSIIFADIVNSRKLFRAHG